MPWLLRSAWRLLRPHLFGLALVVLAIMLPLEVLLAYVDDTRGANSWASYALIGALVLAGALAMTVGILRVNGARWASVTAVTARRLGAVVVLTLVACLGITIGLVLLVVPGVVLATWWFLGYHALLLEERGPFDALARARDLVRGRFRDGIGALAVVVVVCIVPWSTALLSDSEVVDVAAVTAMDVLGTLAFVGVATALYRTAIDSPATEAS